MDRDNLAEAIRSLISIGEIFYKVDAEGNVIVVPIEEIYNEAASGEQNEAT